LASPPSNPERPRLEERIPAERLVDPDALLERFLGWLGDVGLEPYPAQEEAVLELMADRHVILNTPTGSGKSLVALALHFKALCERRRCFYTSPIKALVSEKFFDLCRELGAKNVGMLTGDASINHDAAVVCCTAEVLANMALRDGESAPVDYVVMDEFHFFADPDRGMAWQLPLLTLPQATFLLMSATLGDTHEFEERIAAFTGRPVSLVKSTDRPVPLDYEYRETTLHETLDDLMKFGKGPVYIVNFTQREAAELAQGLTSVNLCTKEERQALADAVGETRFDTLYGKDVKRFLKAGVGLHHAGLLPKYRTLVERLAQLGLLKVIAGTDTLGVGVNVPIRTVLFTKLCKYDGQKVRILSVRDFKQISGRAGRRGFDIRGSVVGQAPEHVIENKRADAKSAKDPKKKKAVKKKPPERGYVHWDATTFQNLIDWSPEALHSQFEVSHGTLLSVLNRDIDPRHRDGGYRRLVQVIARSYEREGAKRWHRTRLASLFRDLREAGVIEVVPNAVRGRPAVRVSEALQRDFSLLHTLSLYMLDALEQLDPTRETYALDVVTLVEAVLEHPQQILERQVDKLKTDLIAKLKAEGVEYEQRIEALERVEHPKPFVEFLYGTFDAFRTKHPWVRGENVRPKSIVRDMVERYANFNEYVRIYGLGRSEGILLRYLTQAYKTLVQSVPEVHKDDRVQDIIAYLRATLARVDATLVLEWERLAAVGAGAEAIESIEIAKVDPAADPKAFRARLRAEMHALVKLLAERDYEEAVGAIKLDPGDPWDATRFEAALLDFVAEHDAVRFEHAARFANLTHIQERAPRFWLVSQTLVATEGPTEWVLEAEVDLRGPVDDDGPLIVLRRIGV